MLPAVYLINRLPFPLLNNKSPNEKLLKHIPSYTHLKTFGSLCFVSTLPLNRSKFDPTAKPCVFIGYPAGIKGYKVLDLASKTIFVSRDVHFLEHIFPFSTSSKPLSPNHSTISDFLDPTSEFCRFSAVPTYKYSSRTCSSTSSFSHC